MTYRRVRRAVRVVRMTTLRQRWCGLMGHDMTFRFVSPPDDAWDPAPAHRDPEQEVWQRWYCRRCGWEMRACTPRLEVERWMEFLAHQRSAGTEMSAI